MLMFCCMYINNFTRETAIHVHQHAEGDVADVVRHHCKAGVVEEGSFPRSGVHCATGSRPTAALLSDHHHGLFADETPGRTDRKLASGTILDPANSLCSDFKGLRRAEVDGAAHEECAHW